MNVFGIGVGAGLVSALLFGVGLTGSLTALLLSVVAPLPIFIAALGWNHRAGLVATVAGAAALMLAFGGTAGIAFLLSWGAPSWWLAYLALLGRPAENGALEWYPLGRLLVWIAATAALVTLTGIVAIGSGSYDAYQETVQKTFDALIPRTAGNDDEPAQTIIGVMTSALPLFFASSLTFVLTLNLWLAAKIVQVSQRLARPWPFIPAAAMPRVALLLLAFSLIAAFLHGFLGAAGLALTGALLSAFSLQGLAFIHDTSRQRPGRPLLLSVIYLFVLFVSQIIMPLLALIGLADVAFGLRSRIGSGGAGPQLPPA